MTVPALLEFKNISKAFGDCVANKSVSFSVKEGTIHALVGENGAGKSTIMKILYGLYQQDRGEIKFKDRLVDIKNPIVAKKLGIGMVHQHFVLAGPISALDHIILDDASSKSFLKPLRRTETLQALKALSEKFQMPLDWNQEVEKMPVGFQQRLEILKLLYNRAKILILDEPTAVLSPQESVALYQQLLELKKQGHTILLVTHKLKDVFKYADELTVFRQGMTLGTFAVNRTNLDEISEMMVGHSLNKFEKPHLPIGRDICLQCQNLNSESLKLKNLNFSVHKGEILGIAGIEGNGQSQLIQAIINPKVLQHNPGRAAASDQGALTIRLLGQEISQLSTLEIRQKGLAYFPEDRLHQGTILDFSLKENFLLGQQFRNNFNKGGWIQQKNLLWSLKTAIKDFDVRPGIVDQTFSELSGGNQQKLVVARELFSNPLFLIAAQPTRGVDIGAIDRIHAEMIKLRSQGSGILLISSDLDEIMKLSDRILVIFQGSFVGEFSDQHFDENKIGKLMTGGSL